MTAVSCSVLLILAFAIRLGYFATTSSSSTTAPTAVPLPTQLGGPSPTSFPNTSRGECAVDYFTCNSLFNNGVCRCDEQLCTQFGDCCAESQCTHDMTGPEFACVSTSVDLPGATAYWMIASCPESESVRIFTGIADLCKAQSLSSPPVSDNTTGLVYRNKYCAQCNGVPDKHQVTWPSEWRCNDTLQETLNAYAANATIDIALLLDYCHLGFFVQPFSLNTRLPLRPRTCDARVTYTCQPPPGTDTSTAEYRALRDLCRSELVNVRITESSNTTVYKNEFCALCSTFGQNLKILCPTKPTTEMGGFIVLSPNTFAIFLDISGSGKVVIASENIVVTTTVERSCGEGEVFDVYSNVCRETLCQPGFIYNGTCLLLSLLSSNCTLIALNGTEYKMISNQLIFWIALERNVTVQGYNSEGNPLVCTNFTANFTTESNETITRALYGYPAAFAVLSYIGLSVDVVAASILLLTYATFAEMRTFYGKLFMNFVLVLLLGDLTFLLGTAVYGVSLEDVVCQVVAILLHYLFLARFVWMSLLSLNVARHFYHALKLIVEEKESWCYLILYMAAGWLSPLLVLIVTVPLNYAVSGTVGYGVDGLCWMNQTLAIIVSFIVPLAICILFTIGAFVFVCIILVKLHRSRSDVTEDVKHKTVFRNCRVLVAVFCVTGAMWLFGFLALIDSALSWAWYIFIILNTTQAVFLTLAYICTVKVLRLYRTALTNCKAFGPRGRRRLAALNTKVIKDDVELKSQRGTNATVTISTIVDVDSG